MSARAYQAVLLGRDKFFRAEVQFEIDDAAGDLVDDYADEQADSIAERLQGSYGRIDVDSVFEITRPAS